MANIPVIPGVKVSTKGILNKPLKDIICALLFGGLNNMLKGPLICVSADIDKLISEYTDLPNLQDLKNELKELKDQLKAAEDALGIKDALNRVNGAIAEVQSLLALDGLCKIPLKAPPITDVLGQVIDAEFAEMNSILNDLGRLAKPELCLSGNGGFGFGSSYNPDSILGSMSKHLNNMGNIPGRQLDSFVKRLKGVSKALKKSVDRQLFPDFRHKHNLATGKPYVPNQKYKDAKIDAPGVAVLRARLAVESNASTRAAIQAEITTTQNTLVPVITLAPPPPLANQWNGPYPPADTPNLKEATAQAQVIVASVGKTASYPVDSNGIRSQNIWPGMLGPDLYALAVTALTPQDPLFAQKDAIYDYCGKLIGYTADIVSGDENYAGGDPESGADIAPPMTNFNFLYIANRDGKPCWAVDGVTSEQVVEGRRGVYLDANPTVELKRSYVNILNIPSLNHQGGKLSNEEEFYICYVDYINGKMQPRMTTVKQKDQYGNYILDGNKNRIDQLDSNGKTIPIVDTFNLGLSRLETGELLEDANGLYGDEGNQRRSKHLFGTNLYFSTSQQVYSGEAEPAVPAENIWWYNVNTCDTKKWVLNRDDDENVFDGTGYWEAVTDAEREANWFGSSNVYNDPHVDYLAYSNQTGTVFGLIKLV